MNRFSSPPKAGTVLIIVAGLSALLALLVMAFLVRVRADTDETSALQRMTQARVMLTAAIAFIMESRGVVPDGPYDMHALNKPTGAIYPHTVNTSADNGAPRPTAPANTFYSVPPNVIPSVDNLLAPWSTGMAWFRVKKKGDGSFLVTVGGGQSGGVGPGQAGGAPAPWTLLSPAQQARFANSPDVYATALTYEYRSWYRVIWEDITIEPKRLPELKQAAQDAFSATGFGAPTGDLGSFSLSTDAWRQFGRIKSITAVDPATLDNQW